MLHTTPITQSSQQIYGTNIIINPVSQKETGSTKTLNNLSKVTEPGFKSSSREHAHSFYFYTILFTKRFNPKSQFSEMRIPADEGLHSRINQVYTIT